MFVCVYVCYVLRKRTFPGLKKIIYMDSYSASRMTQVPFFYFLTLTFTLKVHIFGILLFLRISRKLWEIEQILLLPSDRKSGISHRIAPLWMMSIVTLTYIFKVTQFIEIMIFNMWENSETVRASGKCSSMTFIEIDIGQQMVPLRMLYTVTLTYIFKITNFLEII